VQSALTTVPGVISADVLQADGKAVVKLEKGKATAAQLTDAIEKAGFSAETATN
jgi:copper chaperone CopZ